MISTLKKKKYFNLIGYLFLFICNYTFGQIKKDTLSLSELVLTNIPIQNSVMQSAAAVSVITEKEINQSDGVILTPVLNKISGVFMQQGTLNTNRITIRGIGSRTQYGTSKIKAYFEGIPLSSAEGETVLEDIDLEALGGIEIIKGPNATSFGAGLGGVISLKAKQLNNLVSYGKSGTTFGSFGLEKQTFSALYNDSKSSVFANYTNLQQEGYRANSKYDRQSLNLFGKQVLSENSSLSFFGIVTRLKAYIPSSISETAFKTNPKSAASSWLAARGFESYDKLIAGLGYEHQFSANLSWNSSVFATFKNGYEPRPFDILSDQTRSAGFRSKLNFESSLFSVPNIISVGMEMLFENYSFSLFKNLYQSYPGQGSIQGDQFSETEQKRGYWNGFVQMETKLSNSFHLESGLAFNSTHYNQKDVFQTGNNSDEQYTFGNVLSSRLALLYKVGAFKNIYFSVSKGFSIPSVAETLTADGQFNTNLKSEKGMNYEIGFKGNFLKRKLYTELILYVTPVHDLLVARRIAEDQYVGINAGKSLHKGVEFLLNYQSERFLGMQLNPYFSGTINRFKFKDFVDSGVDYSGKFLPAMPNTQFNLGFNLSTDSGFNFNTSYRLTGKMFLNDANSKETDPYQLLDAKAQYSFVILKKLRMEFYTGIQNLLDEKYASSVLPNAVGFGSAPARYFYPGNPVNYYGGFNVTYGLN